MNRAEGSLWGQWDLHVHSPESIVQDYRGWEAFLADLEGLPASYSAIGINDYLFLDGYRQILSERKRGRLANIPLVLPVLEFRLSMFGGTDGALSKVNAHVIFSEEVDPDVIEAQFLAALTPRFQLSPSYSSAPWRGTLTKEALSDLGAAIKKTVPPERLADYFPDLQEGFNNLTLTAADIREALDKPYFRDKFRLAVGKTEWADIKWNNNSIADKKTAINEASLVFTAAATPSQWAASRDALLESQVNSRLLDCSDAHHHSDSQEKDRIGNCFTWINADPTFEGLCHALHEFETRVYVGDRPPQLNAVDLNGARYIESLEIRKRSGSSLSGKWFDFSLPLNPGFVAIIGNKGKGKSAFTDALGLLAGSGNQESFSFLNRDRFRNPQSNKATEFDGVLTWRNHERSRANLGDTVPRDAVERLKYIPQSLLETICNETPTTADSRFETELGDVIFSHVSEADRLGAHSLNDLLEARTTATRHRIEVLRSELHDLNSRLRAMEEDSLPQTRARLLTALTAKQNEFAALELAKPTPVPEPPLDPANDSEMAAVLAALGEARTERTSVEAQLLGQTDLAVQQATRAAMADRVITHVETLIHQFETFRATVAADVAILGLPLETIAALTTNMAPLTALSLEANQRKDDAQAQLDAGSPDTFAASARAIATRIEDLEQQLDAPRRRYEAYLESMAAWQIRLDGITGNEATPDSIRYLESEIRRLDALPSAVSEAKTLREAKALEIHRELLAIAEAWRDVYEPVQQFAERHPLAAQQFELQFEVALNDLEFDSRFFEMLNRGVTGTFQGVDEGAALLEGIIAPVDFDDSAQAISFLRSVDDALHHDRRSGRGSAAALSVFGQLRRGASYESLYNFLFGLEFISPRYLLQSKGKPIGQLSPGEKGTLLLMFYLLVDKADVPIVIDQPEENLDNQTVSTLLVPAIKEAKLRRQVVLVTHSPNLAIVGDADQVIGADFNVDEFTYASGAIENAEVNRMVLNVLEGTGEAFTNRGEKYRDIYLWRAR